VPEQHLLPGKKGERSLLHVPSYRTKTASSTMIRVHCPAFTS